MSSALKPSEAAALPAWLSRWAPRWTVRPRNRGEDAEGPTAIPAAGWVDIVIRTIKAAVDHDVVTIAAGVTFFAMLAFIPALSSAAALYSLFGSTPTGLRQATALEGVVPKDALALINAELNRVGLASRGQLTWTAIGGLVAAVGAVNAGVTALLTGLNVAYGEEECRSFIRRGMVAACFTAGVFVLVPLTFASLLVGRDMVGQFYLSTEVVRAGRFCFLALIASASLALIYRYGPCRDLARWRWVTPGGALAAVSWLVCSSLVTFYLAHFAHYQETYGVMGALLAVMIWLWTASTVALLGAELNAQVEAQTERDTRTDPAVASEPVLKSGARALQRGG
jgi:membrane protein